MSFSPSSKRSHSFLPARNQQSPSQSLQSQYETENGTSRAERREEDLPRKSLHSGATTSWSEWRGIASLPSAHLGYFRSLLLLKVFSVQLIFFTVADLNLLVLFSPWHFLSSRLARASIHDYGKKKRKETIIRMGNGVSCSCDSKETTPILCLKFTVHLLFLSLSLLLIRFCTPLKSKENSWTPSSTDRFTNKQTWFGAYGVPWRSNPRITPDDELSAVNDERRAVSRLNSQLCFSLFGNNFCVSHVEENPNCHPKQTWDANHLTRQICIHWFNVQLSLCSCH